MQQGLPPSRRVAAGSGHLPGPGGVTGTHECEPDRYVGAGANAWQDLRHEESDRILVREISQVADKQEIEGWPLRWRMVCADASDEFCTTSRFASPSRALNRSLSRREQTDTLSNSGVMSRSYVR